MIMVFGGNGQLGQELSRAAALSEIPLVAKTKSEVDIADSTAVARAISEVGPAIVVNAAAYTKVDAAEDDYAAALRSNGEGPRIVAQHCAAVSIPLIHISTDYVFDGSKPAAYTETDPISPIGAYGRTKAAGEQAVRDNHPQHIIIRTAWVYGEFGNNFLKTVLRLARERDELRIVADQHGCPTSTRDLADAILTISSRLRQSDNNWGTYHYAGDGETTWHGFAAHVVSAQAPITGRAPKVVEIATSDYPTRAKRPMNSALDSALFSRTFGVNPRSWKLESSAVTMALATIMGARPC